MKNLKTFGEFINENLNESKAFSTLSKLGKIERDDYFDDEDNLADFELEEQGYKNAEMFYLETGIKEVDEDGGLQIIVFDDKDFVIHYDSSPYEVAAHSRAEIRHMASTANYVPLPLTKLKKSDIDNIIKDLKENF